MVVLDSLTLCHFKQYAGTHTVPLSPGDGTMTIVAAKNGVGKTSIIDALYIALWGKRGFAVRHPGQRTGEFHQWLRKAHAVASTEEFPHLRFGVGVDCPVNGKVRIERVYWLGDDDVEEEFGVTLNGTPVTVEEGERREDVAARWVETLLPLQATRRFIVDNERLSELNPKTVDDEMRSGLDDLMGFEVLHRLDRHLETLARRADTSREEQGLAERINANATTVARLSAELEAARERLVADEGRAVEARERLKEAIERLRFASEGGSAASARLVFAKAQSELMKSRGVMDEHAAGALPFLLMGLPLDVTDAWCLPEVEEYLEAKQTREASVTFLERVLNRLGNIIEKALRKKIENAAKREEKEFEGKSPIHQAVDGFSSADVSLLRRRVEDIDVSHAWGDVLRDVQIAEERLEAVAQARESLSRAAEGFSLSELIEAVEDGTRHVTEVEVDLGKTREKMAEVEGFRTTLIEERGELTTQLAGLDGEGTLSTLVALRSAISKLMSLKHQELGAPLANGFEGAFRALSRKANNIESVRVDPATYAVDVRMRGFEGNWLDHDLSATERQHVGLALTAALRGLSARALPVVVDTPVSRMDREHKTWSVQRFYPDLSHQTVILATSDDLADGLYDELSASGKVGRAVEIRQRTVNEVEVLEHDLATFFREG